MNRRIRTRLLQLEQEAHRLRAQYAGDLVARAVISCDLAVRKLAWRLAYPRAFIRTKS
jgi:hypothetical protein